MTRTTARARTALRRALACLLAAALALSLGGLAPAYGAQGDGGGSTGAQADVGTQEVIARGTCGKDGDGSGVTWLLDSEGTLTISGTGEMRDHSEDLPLWEEHRPEIKSVVITGGVTSVGGYAFQGCFDLSSVSLLSSMASIGDYAFNFCRDLTSVDIPASVTSIGEGAFSSCAYLDSITVDSGNERYVSEGGALFDKGKTTLVQYPAGSAASSYAVPASVRSIGPGAFSLCASLKSVTIPSSVISIGETAFYSCNSLGSLAVPVSVTSIGDFAFANCFSLASVTIARGVESIGGSAFANCDFESVTIPSSVASVGPGAFSSRISTIYCEALSRPSGWSAGWYEGNESQVVWGHGADTAAPVLSAASAVRRSASAATVTLTSSEAGALYWAAVAPGAPVPAIDTAGAGGPLVAGPQALDVGGLATGAAWDVCVVAKDAAGNVGAVTRVGVPAWEYTVEFKGWDGTAIGAPQKVAHGAGAVAPKPPARAGHTFAGWDKKFDSVTSDLTVTAKYKANTYTVRLDANGGRLAAKAASLKRTYGQALGKLTAKPARAGYTFQGWFTGKEKGTKADAKTKVTRNLTYYAHWKANGPVVTLNANGGKVGKAATASVVKKKGAAVGRLATPTRTGYDFLGWFTGKAKGTKVTARTTVSRNVTYYAHWRAKVYTVRLNANGGKVGKASTFSTKKNYNTKLGKLSTPKRAGHTFQGWYTSKSGGKKVTSATRVTKAVTLYAHWKRAR
jgi:uncharacterized repeat protein (TIGR02543 family)